MLQFYQQHCLWLIVALQLTYLCKWDSPGIIFRGNDYLPHFLLNPSVNALKHQIIISFVLVDEWWKVNCDYSDILSQATVQVYIKMLDVTRQICDALCPCIKETTPIYRKKLLFLVVFTFCVIASVLSI